MVLIGCDGTTEPSELGFSSARENILFYRSIQERILMSVTSVTDSLASALARGDEFVELPNTALSWAYIPPERVLMAERAVRLGEGCFPLTNEGRTPIGSRVGLRIRSSGRVDVLGLLASTGDPCADRLLTEIAGDLWYHWLPNQRFQAPVNVEQPVTLLAASLVGF
jgi:hypothetical protein